MQVGDAVIGTNVSLVGRSSVNPMIVDSPIQFNGTWIRQDGTTMFTEVTTVSDTSQLSSHSSTLRFAPLRSNSIDGGEYIYTVMVEPADSSYILQTSANLNYLLLVRQYPPLNISENIQSLECQPEEVLHSLAMSLYLVILTLIMLLLPLGCVLVLLKKMKVEHRLRCCSSL